MLNFKKINCTKLIKYSYPLTILIMLIISGWFLFFLYKSVYLVMIQVEEVSDLKTKTIQEIIKEQKLNEVIAKINDKNESYNQSEKSNFDPFYPPEPIEITNVTSTN